MDGNFDTCEYLISLQPYNIPSTSYNTNDVIIVSNVYMHVKKEVEEPERLDDEWENTCESLKSTQEYL